ncbi:NUDIX hydrolase [Musicola paradisiaca]|uniref:NUDIX hydrolase n=1 Tax=Musicola paradisiaca (strain Ech703) TaxID=579405 RepID=C6C7N8_MUSP7|nr:NUDIX domain-containing protein [Musicola paradisiaca]ACS85980.1 NUDIX hydrolase [Musicola paradisiaca Ech703]
MFLFSPQDSAYSKMLRQFESQAQQEGITRQTLGAAVVFNGGILLVRRSANDPRLPGYWEIPGGGRTPNDHNLLATLMRELHEETGLRLSYIRHYLGFFDYSLETTNQAGKPEKVRQWNFLVDVAPEAICLCPQEHDAWQIVRQSSEIPDDWPISEESRFVVSSAIRLL